MLKRGVIIFATMCLALLGRGDVLLWSVGEDAYGNSPYVYNSETNPEVINSLQAFVVPYEQEDGMPACARVKIYNSGTSESIILPIYFHDLGVEDGEWGVDLSDSGSGYWGAHWNQSPLENEATIETLFQMEIGHGVDEWETIAWSSWYTKEDLGKESYKPGDINPSGYSWGGWMPDKFYTIQPAIPSPHSIPEPTTFLLLLLGFGILALRRTNGNR